MATPQIICENFEEYGFEISPSSAERCVELCISYSIVPNDFVETYVTFSVNTEAGTEVTESLLDDFERKELTNYKSKSNAKTQQNINTFEYDEIGSDGDDNDVMGSYVCTTPKANKLNRSRGISTPVSSLKDRGSISMESPISATLKDGTGKVVYTFGSAALMKSIDWVNSGKQTIKCERISDNLAVDQHYMYDNLLQKTSIAADRIFDIGEEICAKLIKEHSDKYGNDLYKEAFEYSASSQGVMRCVGRICSDSDDRLGLYSTMLIGADEITLRPYRLHFDRMKGFSLFPGQTVFVQGTNPRNDSFFVDEIIGERNLTYSRTPQVTENLNIIVASGPFTSKTDLIYEPLNELLAYCKQHKPDILILLGPFLDADHPNLLDGTMKVPLETHFFETMISGIVNSVGCDTEVFIVSSSQDAHSTFIYPTAPYAHSSPYKNVTFLPDPCIIKLNGVTIGMTATDIYSHITDAEIAVNAGDKVKRVASYLFNQASFYPLNPPSEKVSVDSGLVKEFATLSIVPNILILKSDVKCFAREVKDGSNGCLILNPGSMWDNQSSTNGTFSRLVVTPANDDTTSLNNIIACQIMKV
ncbi:DNA polymerase alpha subunit B [Contarinia nasturtii]|uniref:DNA polymerase alpha subunit B n=1 Tax=Contarinia nasturtii TaxID=265458 RepID=UPI0012D44107|nr:DNA polymerase alpha subunit B [Contarinia nasturtii]